MLNNISLGETLTRYTVQQWKKEAVDNNGLRIPKHVSDM